MKSYVYCAEKRRKRVNLVHAEILSVRPVACPLGHNQADDCRGCRYYTALTMINGVKGVHILCLYNTKEEKDE